MITTLAQVNILLICSALLSSRRLGATPSEKIWRRRALGLAAISIGLALLHWITPPGATAISFRILRSTAVILAAISLSITVAWVRFYRKLLDATKSPPLAVRVGNLIAFGAVASVSIWGGLMMDQLRLARIPEQEQRADFDPASRPGRLFSHVHVLSEVIGERSAGKPEQRDAAAAYIAERLAESGLEVQIQTFSLPFGGIQTDFKNLYVVFPGNGPEAPVLVVGAHYDSAVGTPGADDNATGVAALLELARAMRGSSGSAEVHLVAFTNEEPPFFGTTDMGSFRYAARLRNADKQLIGMVSLEMLGYYSDPVDSQAYVPFLSPFFPSRGNFIGVASDLGSVRFLYRLRKALPSPRGVPVVTAAIPSILGAVTLSDNLSFRRNGFRALMVSDTAFLRNRHYHKASDLPARLDFARMAAVVDSLEVAIRDLRR